MSLIQSVHSFGLFDNLNKNSSLDSFSMTHRPGSDMVVLPSGPGRIQFYNIHTNSHSFFQDIVGHNQIISNIVDGIGNDSTVILVAFSSDGSHMVTVERRIVADIRKDTMKCWIYSPDKLHYIIHSILDSPHIGGITTITFSTSSSNPYQMVTGGNDGSVKLWWFLDNRWICLLTLSYKQLIPSIVKFSNDNSLLSISFQQTVTFWSVANMTLLGTYVVSSLDSKKCTIQSILFIPGTPLICFSSRNALFLYNMLTLRVVWKKDFDLNCGSLFHLDKDMFCLFAGNSEKTSIFTFDSLSSVPIGCYEPNSTISHPVVVEKDMEKGVVKMIAFMALPNPRIVMLEMPFALHPLQASSADANLKSIKDRIHANDPEQEEAHHSQVLLENSFPLIHSNL